MSDLRTAMEISVLTVDPAMVGSVLTEWGADGWSVGAMVVQTTGQLGVVVQRPKLLIETATDMPKEPHA